MIIRVFHFFLRAGGSDRRHVLHWTMSGHSSLMTRPVNRGVASYSLPLPTGPPALFSSCLRVGWWPGENVRPGTLSKGDHERRITSSSRWRVLMTALREDGNLRGLARTFVPLFRPRIPELVTRITSEIQAGVPAFAGPSQGRRPRLLMVAVNGPVSHFPALAPAHVCPAPPLHHPLPQPGTAPPPPCPTPPP
ncbi:hypothetical protein BHE97_19450, partial [Aeromicrobium sp. PE09-221]